MVETPAEFGAAVSILFVVALLLATGGLVVKFGLLVGPALLLVGFLVSLVVAFFFESVLVVLLGLLAGVLHTAEVFVDVVTSD